MHRSVFIRATLAATLALTVGARTAHAQGPFNFSTSGQFRSTIPGCNNVVSMAAVSCTLGGFTFTFTGVPVSPTNYPSGSIVSLGTIAVSGEGTVTAPAGGSQFAQPPGTIQFLLTVNQTVPNLSAGLFFADNIVGTLSVTNGVVTTNTLELSRFDGRGYQQIGLAGPLYTLITDPGVDGVRLPASGAVTLRAEVFVTNAPEPSTYALLATGLVALGATALRRRTV